MPWQNQISPGTQTVSTERQKKLSVVTRDLTNCTKDSITLIAFGVTNLAMSLNLTSEIANYCFDKYI